MTHDDSSTDDSSAGDSGTDDAPPGVDPAARARLRAAWEASRAVPESERVPVADPDKYAFPVGLDDEGRPHSDEVLRRATRRGRRP